MKAKPRITGTIVRIRGLAADSRRIYIALIATSDPTPTIRANKEASSE